jgi:hypothetical protein
MSSKNVMLAAAVLAAAIPTLTAHAEEKVDPKLQQGIDLCVRMRELIFECKEDFAEAFVARRNPPPERKAALLQKAREEITADGSGPLEPRQKACAAMARPGQVPSDELLAGMKKALDDCAKQDCKARVVCMSGIMKPGAGKSVKP